MLVLRLVSFLLTMLSEWLRRMSQKLPVCMSSEMYNLIQLEMWANAQRDGRPAEHRWRALFNAA